MLTRCSWVGNDPLIIEYHDKEWGVPVHDDRLLFEFLILEGAQAGLSWVTILRKRENYLRVFDNFVPADVAGYSDKKVEELLADPGIVQQPSQDRGGNPERQGFYGYPEGIRKLRLVHMEIRWRKAHAKRTDGTGRDTSHYARVKADEQ